MSVRFPMNVPLLSPLPQQYVSMSSLDARVFCVPLVSIRLLLLGWSLDLCVIYGLSISSVYVQLWFLYFLAGIHRKGPDLKLFEARRSLQIHFNISHYSVCIPFIAVHLKVQPVLKKEMQIMSTQRRI